MRALPLTASVFLYAIVLTQIARRRFVTWTEGCFAAAFFSAGSYALCDFLYFGADTQEAALLDFRLGLSFLMVFVTCLLIFSIVLYEKMRRRYGLIFAACLFFVFLTWAGMVESIEPATWGWQIRLRPAIYALWLAFFSFCVIYALASLAKTYAIVRKKSRALGLRVLALSCTFAFLLTSWLVLEVMTPESFSDSFPWYSSLLLVPAISAFPIILPVTWEGLNGAIRGWKSRRYEVKYAYLIHNEGTLIGARFTSSAHAADLDALTAALEAIDHLVRRSFPLTARKGLKSLQHGDLLIAIESGRLAYLVLILTGEDNELLRLHMREVLAAFESKNAETLSHWKNRPRDAVGIDIALDLLFAREAAPW